MENINVLTSLGVSEQESSAYLALLKLGGSLASAVAKEMGVKRTTVYPILKALAEKGLVTVYFRKNKRFYYPQKPHKVSSMFGEKLKAFDNMVPLLESMEKKKIQLIGLRFIETAEELKQFYDEILLEYKNKEYYIIGNANAWENIEEDYMKEFRKRRGKNNIKTRLLLSSDSIKLNQTLTNKSLLRESKYLPEKYKFKSTIDIYKNKILIVSPDLSSLAVVIAIPAMVDVFKSIFEMLWENN
ncbi:MAG: helix-turn-helix domain-containing protein [bacterium]|nr:helix-turn-helix domain-containing protein [bacterium]